MFVLIKHTTISAAAALKHGDTIFPRPTPWRVAWEAWLKFLARRAEHSFVYLPPKCQLYRYDVFAQNGILVLSDEHGEAYRTHILPQSWGLWWEYAFESFLYGLFFRVWNWRWKDNSRLTKEEMLTRIDRFAAQHSHQHRGTEAIDEDDD